MDDVAEQLIGGIVAALRGTEEERRWAVDHIYRQYAGRIKRYMARSVTHDEAEALMHEVFVRLLRQGHTFREGTQRFEAWLWTIVRNLLIDTVISKRRKDRQSVELEIDADQFMDDSLDPERDAQIDAIQDCFERGYAQFRLEFPRRAAALSWLVMDQLGIQDIAETLGRTPGATRQYLSECRLKLKPFVERCREHLEP
jgi:RNA polymerase sigma-70 factor (ECF subfamily)